MFILGDESHDRGRIPWVTFLLIGLNFLVFCAQVRFGDRLTNGFAVVPKEITEFRDLNGKQPIKIKFQQQVGWDEDGDPVIVHGGTKTHYIQHYPGPTPIFLTLLTYMFLHGDIFHLLFNMWFLWIFGRNVECSLGDARFIGFYVGCGIFAGLVQALTEPGSIVPVVGASGAIAGVMGAYLAIFPFNKIKLVFGNFVMIVAGCGVIEVPAFAVIGSWFILQFLAGMATMNVDLVGGTAIWCHIGGFIAGFCSIKAIVLYLNYRIRQIEGERGPEEVLPDDALKPSDVPTPAEIDAIMDPVEAFRRAREGVFRDVPENDPFQRPVPPVKANSSDAIAAGPPASRPLTHAEELIQAIKSR
jgi:membrane associated rhomboid family serine protease